MSGINRRRAVRAAAPVAGLLAAGLLVWQGSYAAFSASTDNTDDAWSTGNLALVNNGGTGTFAGSTTALFDGTTSGQPENNLKPGDSGDKCITVRSTGSLDGDLALFRSGFTGTNAAALAAELNITVQVADTGAAGNVPANCTGFPVGATTIHSNIPLTSLPTSYGAAPTTAVTGGTDSVTYRIFWELDPAADNTVASSSVVTDLTWEIQ
jgi:hypothetical protein